jgi:1-acyl-sn-glycerol-3-phosphate acyltransferase
MPFPPFVAAALAAASLPQEERDRLASLHFHDAGHGYDAFGLHPDFVALGESVAWPLYKRYFRVRSYNNHHIPSTGPAILAGNHSGSLPIDGMMLWMDVLQHTDPPRVARPIADHFVVALPWIGTFFARGGVVGGSRGNARKLLESGELLMIFPEGTPGIVKPWAERYKLRKFRQGHAEMAIRHSAPIVPVGFVGGEEQLPQLTNSRRLGKLFDIPTMPIPAVPVPLPVRYHIHYGEPIHVEREFSPSDADDPAIVAAVAARVQVAVQALLEAGLSQRKGIFL